ILTTMSEAVVVTNDVLEIEYVNAEAEKLFHSDSRSLYSRSITQIFNNGHNLQSLRDRMMSGDTTPTTQSIEDMTIENINEKRYLRILASPISRSSTIEGFIFVISDVTLLQQAYIELEAAKTGVERIVEERTSELRQAQQKLLEADKLKSEFIMLASHNLRTPLAAIQGYTEILSTSALEDMQKTAVSGLNVSNKRLSSLIDDLLTISSIEAGDHPLQQKITGANELLQEIANETELVASGTTNSLSVEINVGDAQILGNPNRLKAAFNNIFDNAFKFTQHGTITFSAVKADNNLVITISDTGIGIKSDEISKLFTKFHRGTDTLNYNFEGKGLGLYVAKLFITEHRGTVTVQSTENHGTTVVITIPLAE
ncbi:MAG: hybrid sensor histidine kinase/response regulator, partial [Candidatus Saccharibacteria bacterium]|nr:hybrid sensor histidine kinase/response regulator [Candidatus Saccharibacteria bacterium]